MNCTLRMIVLHPSKLIGLHQPIRTKPITNQSYLTLLHAKHRNTTINLKKFTTINQRSNEYKKQQPNNDWKDDNVLDTSKWKPKVNKRWTPLTFVLVFVPILTFGLGTWQVYRLNWKNKLIDDLKIKMTLDPIGLPKKINLNVVPEFEYRKVKIKGKFDHSKEILIESKIRESEVGYHILTPFIRQEEQSQIILINRGFIKKQFKDQNSRPLSLVDDNVEVIGMIRKQEPKSIFQPSNSEEKNSWYFIDINQISNYLDTSPILIDSITTANSGHLNEMLSKGIPIGRSPQIQLRNMHATYIATWYGLSAITSVMAFILLKKPLSGKSKFAGIN